MPNSKITEYYLFYCLKTTYPYKIHVCTFFQLLDVRDHSAR